MFTLFCFVVIYLVRTNAAPPTFMPSKQPSVMPTCTPTFMPSCTPTCTPTLMPSNPSSSPSGLPSGEPSRQPTSKPSGQPTRQPSARPSRQPTGQPTGQPTRQPSARPSTQPTGVPTGQPTSVPSTALQTEIVFDVTIVLSGISYSTYVANINNNNIGLITSLSSISNIDSSQISLQSVYSSDYRKLLIERHRELTTSAITATMQLTANKFSLKLDMDDSAFYSYIKSTIETEITNGNFMSILQSQTLADFVAGVTVLSSSVDVDYETVIVKSALPTGTPTSQPSCGTGSEIDGDGCKYCGPGYITPIYNTESCIPCPTGYYAAGKRNFECTPCTYPWTTVFEGSSSCEAVWFNVDRNFIITLFGVLVALFLFSLSMAGKARFPAFVMMSFPALDILTDLVYLASSKYYNIYLLGPGFFFTFAPNFLFIAKLYELKAHCGLFLDYYPVFWFQNDRRVWWIHDHFNEDLWWLLVPVQLVLCVTFVAWIVLVLPFYAFWFVLGLYFFQSKCLSVTPLRNIWYRVWTGTNDHETDPLLLVDPAVLNESLFAEFLSETLPQLVIQSLNNLWTDTYTLAGYLSTSISVFIAVNGLYRYGYYTLWKGYNIDEVPTKISIGFIEFDLPRPKHHWYASRRRASTAMSTNELTASNSAKNPGSERISSSGRGRRFSSHGYELIEIVNKAATPASSVKNGSAKQWSSVITTDTSTEAPSQVPVDIADGEDEDKELPRLLGGVFIEEIKGCISQAFRLLYFRSPHEKLKDISKDSKGSSNILTYTQEFDAQLMSMISLKIKKMLGDDYEIDSEAELYNPAKAAKEMWCTLMSYRKDLKMVEHLTSLGIRKSADLMHLDENKLALLLDVDHVSGIFDHEDSEHESNALQKLKALADLIVLSNLVQEEEKSLKETLTPSFNASASMFAARGASKDNLAVMVQDNQTVDLSTGESARDAQLKDGKVVIDDSNFISSGSIAKPAENTFWNSLFGSVKSLYNEPVALDDSTPSIPVATDSYKVIHAGQHAESVAGMSTTNWVDDNKVVASDPPVVETTQTTESNVAPQEVSRIDSEPTARHGYWGALTNSLKVLRK